MDSPGFALPPGTMLGNYKLLKTIGRGGFGITYIGWDNQLKRNIVIKECFPLGMCIRDNDTGAISPLPLLPEGAYRAAMDSLRKEAQTLASLNHEHIVRVYEVFEAHGSIFYVMPWLEGGSMRDLIDEVVTGKRTITQEQTVTWLLCMLDALKYLHEKGIYHRDIKPGNILFDDRDKPILIDFGAALNKPDATHTISQGEFSFIYASPEQISGKGEIGPWSDFYTLATSWYELISGKMVESSIQRLMKDDIVPLSDLTLPLHYPKELLASITYNMHLPPEERCQSADQWSNWLNQGHTKGIKRPKKSISEKYLISSGIISGAILLLGGVFLFSNAPPAGQVSHNDRN